MIKESILLEFFNEFSEIIKKYEEYIKFFKKSISSNSNFLTKTLVSGAKVVIIAPSKVLDELEEEINKLEAKFKVDTMKKPCTIVRNRLKSVSDLKLNIKHSNHTQTMSIAEAEKTVLASINDFLLTEKIAVEDENDNLSARQVEVPVFPVPTNEDEKELLKTLNDSYVREQKEINETYDMYEKLKREIIDTLSKYDSKKAIRLKKGTGNSYKVSFYNDKKEKRESISINNLLMIESDKSELIELEEQAKRRKRSDVKKALFDIELRTNFHLYEPLDISFDEYKKLHQKQSKG